MNSKTVLNKIMQMLSLTEEVALTYAKLADGTIVESKTFDVGEDLFVVSEDGTKSPAPNGFHDLMLKDTEGNETLLKVKSEDGKIVERENVEMADVDADMVKTEPIPAVGNEDKENVMPDLKGQVTSGTLKMAEETDEVMPLPEDTEAEDEAGEDKEVEINLGKKMEEMVYRIEEMEKKMMKMEEAMMPPLSSEVAQEVDGIKMAEVDEEELPKLDGAPIEDPNAVMKFEANRKNYGKKLQDPQSSFLSKLYN
jgi:hypothetical protein